MTISRVGLYQVDVQQMAAASVREVVGARVGIHISPSWMMMMIEKLLVAYVIVGIQGQEFCRAFTVFVSNALNFMPNQNQVEIGPSLAPDVKRGLLPGVHNIQPAMTDDVLSATVAPAPLATAMVSQLRPVLSGIGRHASSLPFDSITANLLDWEAVKKQTARCSQCTDNERKPARGRCSVCSCLLCEDCFTAHQTEETFRGHRVEPLPQYSESVEGKLPFHIAETCPLHPNHRLSFYCLECEVPACDQCRYSPHPFHLHRVEPLIEAEKERLQRMRLLQNECEMKAHVCQESQSTLENSLTELQFQRENTRSHIDEVYQSYRAILEEQKEKALAELEQLGREKELRIMETLNQVGTIQEKLEDATSFSKRVLENGSGLEAVILQPTVCMALTKLSNDFPAVEIDTSLDFISDVDGFRVAVKETFGHIRGERVATRLSKDSAESSLPSTSSPASDVMGFSLGLGLPREALTPLPNHSPPTLISASKYEQDSMLSMPFSDLSPNGRSDFVPQQMGYLQYNLQKLALLEQTSTNTSTSGQAAAHVLRQGSELRPRPGSRAELDQETSLIPAPRSRPLGSDMPNAFGNMDLIDGSSQTHGFSAFGDLSSPLSSVMSDANLGAALFQKGALPPLPLTSNGIHATPPPTPSVGNFPSPNSMAHYPGSLQASGRINNAPGPPLQYRRSYTGQKPKVTQICFRFGAMGASRGEFQSPHGFCLGPEEEIIIADTNNHRIQVFEPQGEFRLMFGEPGRDEGHLWFPRKVAFLPQSGKFVVCDRGSERSRMQLFSRTGQFIKKITIRYINIVAGLTVNQDNDIVAVDSVHPGVYVINENGELKTWFECSQYMREPSDIAVYRGQFYICDFKGHCVNVFSQDGSFVRKIGNEAITTFPNGIDISDAGDVLIGDSHGNRFHISCFTTEGALIAEYECPYAKVSRCCGLKLTSEGYIVTVAKNNHHVLILNTLHV
ncbi:unnamed protein product [Darwinula stevensoni]|uniref:B box-type domain-containing protein n=1 Tax=Darwinula stevensoni TaxID=69355 RepID=A0A7R8X834_9CRUS|nr:unnamed protein product [Darwinula stevensoni]CAG0883996.1 unnamed protein product [Darwinula stevensoni]